MDFDPRDYSDARDPRDPRDRDERERDYDDDTLVPKAGDRARRVSRSTTISATATMSATTHVNARTTAIGMMRARRTVSVTRGSVVLTCVMCSHAA